LQDDGSELHQSALNYTPVLGACRSLASICYRDSLVSWRISLTERGGNAGASKQAANIQSPGSASSEPPALVPKIETLRAHIAKLRTNIKNWDEDFVNELEKCIQVLFVSVGNACQVSMQALNN
jgi:hypothetical protein